MEENENKQEIVISDNTQIAEKKAKWYSHYKDTEIRDVFAKCFGIHKLILKQFGITQRQLSSYLGNNHIAREWILQARDGIVDEAENVILNALQDEDIEIRLKAAEFTLKTLGKHRGWNDKDGKAQVSIAIKSNEEKKKKIKSIFNIDTLEKNDVKGDVDESIDIEEDSSEIDIEVN